jgi:integrase
MSVRKICKAKGCTSSPRCDHEWWFDLMHQGTRWRMPVNDFAIPRGATEPVTSKQAADRVWWPKFVAEVMAGRDPRQAPTAPPGAAPSTVADLLDRYYKQRIEPEQLRSWATVKSRIKGINDIIGAEPASALERQETILRFKGEFAKGREVATVNRSLSLLRAAINWAMHQDPPLLTTTPFHRFGITISKARETQRDRRLAPGEEQALLQACAVMQCAEHKWVGEAMHDRIIGALETCCRQGEMLRIQNRHVDWERQQIIIPAMNAKDGENRRIPFDPEGRLAPILKRRGLLGPSAFVFGTTNGAFQERFKSAWESLLLIANGFEPTRTKPGGSLDRTKLRQIDLTWHDLRHEGACRLLADGVDIRSIQLILGHSDVKTTQRYLNVSDEELLRTMTGVWERRKLLRAVNV